MSIQTQITCDVCSIKKIESNHWFRVAVRNGVYRSGAYKEGQTPWIGEKHACGAGHADALHHRFVTTGKLDKEMHPEPEERPVGLTEAGILGKKEPVPYQEGASDNPDKVQTEEAVGREEGSPPAVD